MFNNLNARFVTDNKLFWKTIEPFFKLIKANKILNDNEKIAEELNNFFRNAVSYLNTQENLFIQSKGYHNLSYPIQGAIAKYNTIQAFH